jgi:hypothetical protein
MIVIVGNGFSSKFEIIKGGNMNVKRGDKCRVKTKEGSLLYIKIGASLEKSFSCSFYKEEGRYQFIKYPTLNLKTLEVITCFPWEKSSSGATSEKSPTKCSCSSYDLFNFGCTCGFMKKPPCGGV